MNRRKALKNIGVSFGSITFSTGFFLFFNHVNQMNSNWSPNFFTEKQLFL
jgi:hypothetical protein